MELIHGLHNLRPDHHGCVLSIGKFDGVHLGHAELLARARRHADQLRLPVTVMTFDPTPAEFFARSARAARISTQRDNMAALSAMGVDRLLLLRFGDALAQTEPLDFVEQLVVQGLGARALVVGDDFRFGRGRGGDLDLLQRCGARHGFLVEHCASVMQGAERVSSTAIRSALAVPDLAVAQRLMGRRYCISGRVRGGLRLGRELGMPTANLVIKRPLALRRGVYAVVGHFAEQSMPGVASLGVRPTLGLRQELLETHLFGEPGSLYGALLRVEFHSFLRPEHRFNGLDALREQMHADAAQARALLQSLNG